MDLASKLQLKAGQHVVGISVPEPVASVLPMTKRECGEEGTALLAFVANKAELSGLISRIAATASEDRLTWVAYPKSGQLGTDLNRDSLASVLTEAGIQPVRQVSIDGIWSALRFRPSQGLQ